MDRVVSHLRYTFGELDKGFPPGVIGRYPRDSSGCQPTGMMGLGFPLPLPRAGPGGHRKRVLPSRLRLARKRCTMDRIKVGEGGFGLILTFLPWNILIAVDRVTQRIISSLGG